MIAILAIITGATGIGISLASSRDSEKAAKQINAALENSRLCAMSRSGDFTLTIDLSNNEMTVLNEGTEELPANVDIRVQGVSGAGSVQVQFDKSTGRVQQILVDGTAYTDGVLRITSENQNGKRATVVLVAGTGKHYVDYA